MVAARLDRLARRVPRLGRALFLAPVARSAGIVLGTGLLVSASVLAVVQWADGMTEAPALLSLAVVAGAGGLLAVLCTRR